MRSTMIKLACIGAFAAIGFLAAGAASAQMYGNHSAQPIDPNPAANGTPPSGMPTLGTINDKDFTKQAAEGDLAEVRLGQLAQDKGSSDAVKDFGKRMVAEHTKANEQLTSIATERNMEVPRELDKHNQKIYDQLSKLSGDEFDRAYAKDMVNDHRDNMDLFQREASGGQDGILKNFASSSLPTLQDHLKMAKDLQKTVSGKGTR
jgi:putative membrane protein